MSGRSHVGTSGWVYPHWKGRFYPEGLPERRWFQFYAQHFDTVEINNTFYRLPTEKTVGRWREQAPEGFVYAVKASRFLTHIKRLKDVGAPLEQFLDIVGLLRERLGPVLAQLPESFHLTGENFTRLRVFCRQLPPRPPFALEFRHASWFTEDVYAVLQDHGVGLCIVSDPERPTDFRVTSGCVYVRFHGSGDQRYQGKYTEAELGAWARQIAALAAGRDAYLYFNNDYNAYAVRDARRLRELLGVAPPPGRSGRRTAST
jgi:uncharacterized protein YecE (DUF72 family)